MHKDEKNILCIAAALMVSSVGHYMKHNSHEMLPMVQGLTFAKVHQAPIVADTASRLKVPLTS